MQRNLKDLNTNPVHTNITQPMLDLPDVSRLRQTNKAFSGIPYMRSNEDCMTKSIFGKYRGCPFTDGKLSDEQKELSQCSKFCGKRWEEWLPTFIQFLPKDMYWYLQFDRNGDFGRETKLNVSYINDDSEYIIYDNNEDNIYDNIDDCIAKTMSMLKSIFYEFGMDTIELKLTVDTEDYGQNFDNELMRIFHKKYGSYLVSVLQNPKKQEEKNEPDQPITYSGKSYGFPNDEDYHPTVQSLSLNNVAPPGYKRRKHNFDASSLD